LPISAVKSTEIKEDLDLVLRRVNSYYLIFLTKSGTSDR
jgi:hypothetical protein